ncbi:MAG: hypothetical protein WD069_01250 [Planctomycetales bacterium]
MAILKRLVPLIITAAVGFLLIVANYVPWIEWLEQKALTWFDVLAAIAFVLGGGNLLAGHLKKISDRARGWGYSAVTILAFLVTLIVGLGKIGVPPASDQEHYGETFAELDVDDLPSALTFSVPGRIPEKDNDVELPKSAVRQIGERDGNITFRGWIRPNQQSDLLQYEDTLEWKCTVERLFEAAQPPPDLKGKLTYYADHSALGFSGAMSEASRTDLLALSDDAAWIAAVDALHRLSDVKTTIDAAAAPEEFTVPESLADALAFDRTSRRLTLTGPLSPAGRRALTDQFPRALPQSAEERDRFRAELEGRGQPLTTGPDGQRVEFDKALDASWMADQLRALFDLAGQAPVVPRTACEMLEDMQAGRPIVEKRTEGEDVSLNDAQAEALERFAAGSLSPDALPAALAAAGPWEERQDAALKDFLEELPTAAERNRDLYFALAKAGLLTEAQRDFLMADYRRQLRWEQTVGRLFVRSNPPKYPWSGDYTEPGTPFWWLYEYALKPLTATMFALLAFFVASAAFRAFRAKNVEAALLLGTAFIILLGRTAAGVALTSWLPEEVAGLRIENVTVFIMGVFNTAGNRAIMIGIALGLAATSLRILLGIDRSYLGGGED